MVQTKHIAGLGALSIVLMQWLVSPQSRVLAGGQEAAIVTSNPAPTSEQIKSLFTRAMENQHRNDRAIEEFERYERVVSRRGGENSEIISDHTDRIVPSGNGTMKLPVAENGKPVSQEFYRGQLQYAVGALELALHPNERYRQDLVKFEKRRRDRAELVENSVKAFRVTWAGRETRGSRTLAKFLLEPDPNYKPTTRLAATFEHVRAVLWVDESQAQFARLECDIISDITFVGGIAGKVYRGGHFMMEQWEVAPGVWLPTIYVYDVDGRKFLFGFGIHERTEVTRYRRVGPPAQAIELVRAELNSLPAQTPKR